jgi:hypothetical protein
MKEKLREFLKPTIWKLIITIIIAVILIFLSHSFPMSYNVKICNMMPVGGVGCGLVKAQAGVGYPVFFGEKSAGGDVIDYGLYPVNLLINIIICYFIASLIVTVIKKNNGK